MSPEQCDRRLPRRVRAAQVSRAFPGIARALHIAAADVSFRSSAQEAGRETAQRAGSRANRAADPKHAKVPPHAPARSTRRRVRSACGGYDMDSRERVEFII